MAAERDSTSTRQSPHSQTTEISVEAVLPQPHLQRFDIMESVAQKPKRWCIPRDDKNKPQSSSVGAACMILMSGGMNLSWSFMPDFSTKLMVMIWFIGAILGAMPGAVFSRFLPKKIIMFSAAVMVMLGGILLVALPNDYEVIIMARLLDGIAIGMVISPMLIMASELAVKTKRGSIASLEQLSLSLGMFLQAVLGSTTLTNANFNDFVEINRLQGAVSLFFGFGALFMTFAVPLESPVYYLLRDKEPLALDMLRRLQQSAVVTEENYEQLVEHKLYISSNDQMTLTASIITGLPALWKLCLYRALVALSYSIIPFIMVILLASSLNAAYCIAGYGLIRLVGAFFSHLFMDLLGRKKPMLFSLLICCCVAIAIGVIYNSVEILLSSNRATTVMSLIVVYQFFAGIFANSSSVYLAEAFPLIVKPFYISFAFIVEMSVQLIIYSVAFGKISIEVYFFALGALTCAFFLMAYFRFPETKNTTLREAQAKFKGFFP